MAATKSQKQKFISLRAEGFSFDEISKRIKISKPTLIKWGKEFENEIREIRKIADEMFIFEEKIKRNNRAKRIRIELEKAYRALEKTKYDKLSKKEIIHLIDKLESKFAELSKIDESKRFYNEVRVSYDDGKVKNSGAKLIEQLMKRRI